MTNARQIRVFASDGQLVGRLQHVIADRNANHATGLVIERDGNEVILPLNAVRQSEGDSVTLSGPASQYSDLPAFHRSGLRVIDEEIEREERARELGIDEDFQIGEDEDEDELSPSDGDLSRVPRGPQQSRMRAEDADAWRAESRGQS